MCKNYRVGVMLVVVSCVITMSGKDSVARATVACPNSAVREESDLNPETHLPLSMQLPECRAYELMSPPFKAGFDLTHMYAVAGDGSRVLVRSLGAFAGTKSNPRPGAEGAVYELVRNGSGWSAVAIDPNPAQFPYQSFENLGISKDLRRTLWSLREPSQSIYTEDLYVREPSGAFVKMGPSVPPLSGPAAGYSSANAGASVNLRGASSDLSHAVFSIRSRASTINQSYLWSGDTTSEGQNESLYEYAGTGNSHPDLVGVSDGSTVLSNKGASPLPSGILISDCGTFLGGLGEEGDHYNAVSANGERVLFTAAKEVAGKCTGPSVNELYARVNGLETVPISEPIPAACEKCATATKDSAEFQGASEDGSKVFFMTEQSLLGTAGEALYEYDFQSPAGSKIVSVSGGVAEPEVRGVARVSEDGSHAYFIAGGVFATTGTATTTAGSNTLTAVSTATGTGALSAATGTVTTTSGSKTLTAVATTTGAFAVGQAISGTGIPAKALISAVGAGTLTVTIAATASGVAVPVSAGTNKVKGLTTTTGVFAVGQAISGVGIPAGTTITGVEEGGALTLSALATASGVQALSAGAQPFAKGEVVAGAGIPVGATIMAVNGQTLELSVPATVSASGVMVTVANAEGIAPVLHADNLYVFERDAKYPQGHIAFVAEMCSGEGESGLAPDAKCHGSDENDWRANGEGPTQATPDGRFLVFPSVGDLTADDTSTVQQVFEYDAQRERLVRVSVGQQGSYECKSTGKVEDGYNCNGNTEEIEDEAKLPEYLVSNRVTNLGMSDDGSHVFFTSADGLAPGSLDNVQINEYEGGFAKTYAQNVYEYESSVAASGGSIADGSVYLLSDGQDRSLYEVSRSGVELYGTDASGNDVFFSTADQLVKQDTDTQRDLYDARVVGGFPAPLPTASCTGEACLPGLSAAPLFRGAASSSTIGGQNVTLPASSSAPIQKAKPLTQAQKLAIALKACRKQRAKKQRAACKARAKKRYAGGATIIKSGGRSQ